MQLPPPGPRGAALPIAEVRTPVPRSTRHRALAAVIATYLLAAAVTVPVAQLAPRHGWIALHLLLLGAATNAIVVFSRHFAQALLHARGGSERAATVRLCVLNTGVVGVLLGVSLPAVPVLAVGGALVVAAVLAHVASLVRMQRRATLSGRLGVVVGFYVAAGIALSVGGVAGALLGAGVAGSAERHAALHLGHVHLNLLGWVGLTVVGTTFMLWPAVLRTKMAEDAARVAKRVLVVTILGVAATAGGLLVGFEPVAVAGLITYAVGVLWSLVPAVRIARVKPPTSSAAFHLAAATAWLLISVAVDVVAVWRGQDAAMRAVDLLVPVLALGFVAQVLVAGMSFLVPVTVGGGPAGNRRLTAVLETGWPARIVLANTGLALLALPLPSPADAFGWALALVGLGSFAPLLATALVRSRTAATAAPPVVPAQPVPAVPGRRPFLPASGLLVAVAVLGLVTTGTWPQQAATATSGDSAGSHVVQVELGEMLVRPAVITVPKGERVVLEVRNTGTVRHDLRLASGAATPLLSTGQSASLVVGPLDRSTSAWCTVAGHRQAGMTLRIEVGDAPASAPAGAPVTDEPGPDWQPYDPTLAPAPDGQVHDVTLEVVEADVDVAPGVRQRMWTFGGSVPGPVLRGRVGDVFHVRLVNSGSLPHSVDLHASQVSPDRMMRSIEPGGELVYSFRAERAGAWLYHCGTMPVLQHVGMGMYGAVVIDPPDLTPVDRELLLVQSEVYLGEQGAVPEMEPMVAADYDLVAFNGYAHQYDHAPVEVTAGERVRIWVVDAGPSASSAFHVVGTQFDTVYREGSYLLRPSDSGGAQVLDLAPAQGGFVELVVPEPGRYPMISHRLADAARGAAGALVAR
jgi:nitrite reductase (NO-forming)